MRTRAKAAAAAAMLILLIGAIGCAPQEMRIQGADATLAPDDGSPGFLDRVASMPTVPEHDALRGMLLLMDGDDSAKTFGQRVQELTDRDILPRGWSHDPAQPTTKGRLAYMICRACKIRGGVVMTLTGPSQRYCLRELQYRKMMSPGTPTAEVSGMEYVAVLSRADIFRRTGQLPAIMEATGGGR